MSSLGSAALGTRTHQQVIALLLSSVVVSTVAAQDPAQPTAQLPLEQAPVGGTPAKSATAEPQLVLDHQVDSAGIAGRANGDYFETHMQGGFRVRMPQLGLQLRGNSLLILNDLEATRAQFELKKSSGLPTRSITSPNPRRQLSPEVIRERLRQILSVVDRGPASKEKVLDADALNLFRYLYCEGDIVVVQNGVEVLRCDRMWISPVDNRIVVENAELRYITGIGALAQTLTVRAPRLVKQGPRWIGSDALLTTCTAAQPHAALAAAEIEIIERPGEFEVISRGQTLQVSGTNMLPIPDAHFFTGSQNAFPIKSVTAGYADTLGAQLGVVVGLPWNAAGGAMHHWLTGRPADEFRGEWRLGVGWIQQRGVPLSGSLTYAVPNLYEGRTEAFFIDDSGQNVREINSDINGTLIGTGKRSVLRTENRFYLNGIKGAQNTHVDFVAFQASDASVYSEFFVGPYRIQETPETSTYLHHSDGNHLLTVGTRFNLSDFSYRDDRFLATRFIEELPVLTYQWLGQPIAETPWETPIVLDVETSIGQRRSDYDFAPDRISDRSLRVDQLVELSAPFAVGALNFRPFVSGRGTFYDKTANTGSEERIALEGGFQVGSRFSRTWRWLDDQGKQDAVRHVIAPKLTYRNRYHVDDQPTDFFQYDDVNPVRLAQLGYDSIDLLSERELVRLEVRNLWQKMEDTSNGRQPRDFIYLDLAQDVLPNSARDNGGEQLGLFFYDLLLRPTVDWLPLDNLAFGVYGDYDWKNGMQTFDTELQFGKVLGLNWTVEYREDALVDGAISVGATTRVFDRWDLFGQAQRDLDRDEWLAYVVGLTRNDHDWAISVTAVYNPFINETTFRIMFEPRFGRTTQGGDRFGGSNVTNQSYSF
jgi:hypothetical protein